MRSAGIDLSASATGLVMLDGTYSSLPEVVLETEISFPKMTGVARTRAIVGEVMEALHEHKPDKIVVEGYSLNLKNASSVIPLVEIGGLLRFCLQLDDLRWYDPRAPELKKFVVGSGNAAKDQMMMWVLKRWQHTSKTNNTADGYGLAAMGLALGGSLPGLTKDQVTVIGKLAEKSN